MTRFTHIILMLLSLTSAAAYASDDWTGKRRNLSGNIVNAVTGAYVSDSISVELLSADSAIVAKGYNRLDDRYEYSSSSELIYGFNIALEAPGENFIIRLSHPDYATAYYPVSITGYTKNAGRLNLRKLSAFEKGLMLGELTVRASVIQVVNKGDTIQYNADAFAVAKGSMLDALIEKMPGVELRDGGQIYVNGRFVDRLLLDGKDFFKGDQFVLLQNLPAYTVKNLKVYEQASASHEVYGFKTSIDPDLYVMDITLKKGYNSGYIANAEAGGGTHDRYRGRAFGMVYNKTFRLGAFGFINNLNETRNPGRNGGWEPADSKKGMTTSKGGGLSYGYFAPNRTVEFNGTTSAQYIKTGINTQTNVQNFISGGDSYARRWSDESDNSMNVSTENTVSLRPAQGNSYNHFFMLNAAYGKGREKESVTEGTFASGIGNAPGLRDELERGWVDGMNALNRYLAESKRHSRQFDITGMANTTLSLPGNDNGLMFVLYGQYNRQDNDGSNFSNYLLQYAGGKPAVHLRSNPLDNHGFNYNAAVQYVRRLGSFLNMISRIDYYNTYEHNSNRWYTEADSLADELLPSMRADAMMRLDPRNSYITGKRYTNLRPWLSFSFQRTAFRDGQPYSEIFSYLDLKAHIRRNAIDFNGLTVTHAEKKYVSPEIRTGVTFKLHRMLHQLSLSYSCSGNNIDPFDLIDDVVFDSDPLAHRTGNPDLKQTITHSARIFYYNNNWMLDLLKIYVDLNYFILHNREAMSYAYDRATGIRTYRPVNVDGNRYGEFVIGPTVALTRDKNLKLVDYLKFQPRRSVDIVSYDGFVTSQTSVVNSLYISEYLSLEYNAKKFMAAFDGQIETRRTTSADEYFDPFRITTYRYGVRGRVTLPAGFEINTDLKMYSTRGFDYHAMNTNQLVWNARVTKSFLDGRLMMFLDGYDILGKVKNITYNVNEQGRTETWVNNIPSYVMLSLRWNFTKKPRE